MTRAELIAKMETKTTIVFVGTAGMDVAVELYGSHVVLDIEPDGLAGRVEIPNADLHAFNELVKERRDMIRALSEP